MADDGPSSNPVPPGQEPSSDLAAGFLVGGGRFTLLREVARGGMGIVWLAHDERLGAPVALKFLPAAFRADPISLTGLRQETQKSRTLSHPNIIRIYDLYEAPGEAGFISMEYVDGPNLWGLLTSQPKGFFYWDYLRPIVRQLCDALEYAHGERVIHRDLKPANMLLDERQRLRLADFGIAARTFAFVVAEEGTHPTSGTVSYMSPQQIEGHPASVSDDIYALGATLYELLSGRPPFYENDVVYQVVNVLPTPLAERLADLEIENPIPAGVAAMVMACLSKDPEKRPKNVRALAEWSGLMERPKAAGKVAADTVPLPRKMRVELPVVAAVPTVPVELVTAPVQPLLRQEERNSPMRRWMIFFAYAGLGLMALLAWDQLMRQGMKSAPFTPSSTNRIDKSGAAAGAALTVPDASENSSVSIEMGATNHEQGLVELRGMADRFTSPAVMNDKECRLLEFRQRGRCYLKIDQAFKRTGSMNVRIQVEYFAEVGGMIQVQFDGSDPHPAPHYSLGGRMSIDKTNVWKTVHFQINDALFQNGELLGADFRISTSSPKLYIRRVSVFFDQ